MRLIIIDVGFAFDTSGTYFSATATPGYRLYDRRDHMAECRWCGRVLVIHNRYSNFPSIFLPPLHKFFKFRSENFSRSLAIVPYFIVIILCYRVVSSLVLVEGGCKDPRTSHSWFVGDWEVILVLTDILHQLFLSARWVYPVFFSQYKAIHQHHQFILEFYSSPRYAFSSYSQIIAGAVGKRAIALYFRNGETFPQMIPSLFFL